MSEYHLSFLPQFSDDLNEAVSYITYRLKNPQAADDLIDAVDEAINERLQNPEVFEQYPSKRKRPHAYYRIYVKNYIVFYVVLVTNIGKVMEVRRLLHTLQVLIPGKRNGSSA